MGKKYKCSVDKHCNHAKLSTKKRMKNPCCQTCFESRTGVSIKKRNKAIKLFYKDYTLHYIQKKLKLTDHQMWHIIVEF